MTAPVYALLLGALSGLFLTLMDRIDEHGVVQRFKTPLAWLCGVLAACCMILSMQRFAFVYPFIFAQCLEWIVKGKIDFPSHVFCLFLLGLWFGSRIDLLRLYALAIALFLALRWFSGSWLKTRIAADSRAWRVVYGSYLEKFLCGTVLALFVGEWLLLIYVASYTVLNFFVKRLLPGQQNGTALHA